MNRTLLTLALAAALPAASAQAQNSVVNGVVQPTSPAAGTASASAPAPVVVESQNAPAANTSAATPSSFTQIVYSPKLPTAADLTSAAAQQGLTVERIVQTANQVIAFYRNGSGQTTTVAYQALPPSGSPAPAPAPVVVTAPPPTVVYQTAPRVVYYDDYYPTYYAPRYWYPPVSLSFGFGYRSFHGGHGRRW